MTPLMSQYWEIKNQHKDKLLLFRMGDFFEMFYDDAVVSAPILGIALTQRNRKSEDDTPMCGMPHHSVEGPITKLLKAGFKVAICDQIEDPKLAKGIVKRAVTRILSPGMVYDPETVDGLKPNYLCSFDHDTTCFLDPTTGESFFYRCEINQALRLLALHEPVEIILPKDFEPALLEQLKERAPSITHFDFADDQANLPAALQDQSSLPTPAKRLIYYASSMQGAAVTATLLPFSERTLVNHMELSPTVLRHLEIFETYKGETKGSFFQAINRTKTPGGARTLKKWLTLPLIDPKSINERQERISYWLNHTAELSTLRQRLAHLGDFERRLGKISHPNANARDLKLVQDALAVVLEIADQTPHEAWPQSSLHTTARFFERLQGQLVDDPPLTTKNGGMIRAGFSSELDRLIELTTNSKKSLTEMELREKEATQIPSLKIKYNNVFGYYIEITHTHKNKVPHHYHRKQTLTSAERYTTEELERLEQEILQAQSKRWELEWEIFSNLRQELLGEVQHLLPLCQRLNELDVSSALGWLAMEQNYCRPEMGAASIEISGSRHAVLEQFLTNPFVKNDLKIEQGTTVLITGPNMAGKSTLMRQVATSLLLAQIGSFIPASRAKLPIVDKIFTRVGASDFLTEGLSTFMVEMQETAQMLAQATPRSFIILDEVGRGTSTYDGMSLAQAILEHLLNRLKATVLFATHYHELTRLSHEFPQLENWHLSIKERREGIHFLYTLMRGPASKSYGIQVAQLAGLPPEILRRASAILQNLESQPAQSVQTQLSLLDFGGQRQDFPTATANESGSLSAAPPREEPPHPLFEALRNYPLEKKTPLEALNQIAQWQTEAKSFLEKECPR